MHKNASKHLFVTWFVFRFSLTREIINCQEQRGHPLQKSGNKFDYIYIEWLLNIPVWKHWNRWYEPVGLLEQITWTRLSHALRPEISRNRFDFGWKWIPFSWHSRHTPPADPKRGIKASSINHGYQWQTDLLDTEMSPKLSSPWRRFAASDVSSKTNVGKINRLLVPNVANVDELNMSTINKSLQNPKKQKLANIQMDDLFMELTRRSASAKTPKEERGRSETYVDVLSPI